ncbi:hypothetical protein JTB14_027569 [Gonioctena quinquepunctata]|nr:hypothetical protein JTB14_027569 [Gonioctena quinquepunctata]
MGIVPDLRHNGWYFSKEPIVANTIEHISSQTSLTPMEKIRLQAVVDRNLSLLGRIKECLVAAPIWSCPDYTKPFVVQTDASGYSIAAVPTQSYPEGDKVISYLSRSLTKQERNFTTTERKCLTVLWAIEKLRPYLEGVEFTVVTDHFSLLWLHNLKDLTGRLARWAVRLQQYHFKVVHRKGSSSETHYPPPTEFLESQVEQPAPPEPGTFPNGEAGSLETLEEGILEELREWNPGHIIKNGGIGQEQRTNESYMKEAEEFKERSKNFVQEEKKLY